MANELNQGRKSKIRITENQISCAFCDFKRIDEIKVADPTKIQTIAIHNSNLQDIDGLVEFPNLKKINLMYNNITNMSVFGSLKFLEEIILPVNPIIKIENLDNLKRLTTLRLDRCKISRIEGLDNLNLKDLFLSTNEIVKIEGLDHVNCLRVLDLTSNKIKKIEGLENSKNLNDLYLKGNPIQEIEGLSFLSKLERIQIDVWHDVSSDAVGVEKQKGFRSLLRLICVVKDDILDKIADYDTLLKHNIVGLHVLTEYLKEKNVVWLLQQAGPKLTSFISNLLENPKYQSLISQDVEIWKYMRDRSKEFHKN